MGGGADVDRIARGELASSTEARLQELVGWGGFSSFMTPAALAVCSDAEIEPIGQVIGLAAGAIRLGYIRTTRPGQGRRRLGVPRWLEHTGPLTTWTGLRTRALGRLTQQATMLGADAVVGVGAERLVQAGSGNGGGLLNGQLRFAGTAVRLPAPLRTATPVLTLASAQEVWAMLQSGLQPAGIAGGFACVQTIPGSATVSASYRRWRSARPNVELEDLTAAVYEVRRLAMERLVADARTLQAAGLLGIELNVEAADSEHSRVPNVLLSLHVLASAVRRAGGAGARPATVVAMSERARA